MHRLSAPSAPLVVFLAVMVGERCSTPRHHRFRSVSALRSCLWCSLYPLEKVSLWQV